MRSGVELAVETVAARPRAPLGRRAPARRRLPRDRAPRPPPRRRARRHALRAGRRPARGPRPGPGRPPRRRRLARPSPRTASIYWTYAKPMAGGTSATAAARGRLAEDGAALTDVQDIFVQDPASPTTNHYGSRIVPDGAGHLFVTTGEHFDRERSASSPRTSTRPTARSSASNLDGTPPADNPFAGAGRRHPRDLVARPPQHPGRRARRRRPALDRRARAAGRRRAQPHRAGRQLRLAGDQLRRELRRLARRRGHHRPRGHGAAALLLGPGDRPERHGLLRRRDVPRLAGRPPDRRAEPRRPGAPQPRRRHRHRRGAAPHRRRPHPRRGGRPRRRGPGADRRRRRRAAAADAEAA